MAFHSFLDKGGISIAVIGIGFKALHLALKTMEKNIIAAVTTGFEGLREEMYSNSAKLELKIDSKFEVLENRINLSCNMLRCINLTCSELSKEIGGINNNIGILVETNVRSCLLKKNYSEAYLLGEKLNSLSDLAKKICRKEVSTDNSPPSPDGSEFQTVEGTSEEVEYATSMLLNQVCSGIYSFAEAMIKAESQSDEVFRNTQLKSLEVGTAISKPAWDGTS